MAGVAVAESGGSTEVTEGGATDTYTVVLNTTPTSDVSVTIDPDGQLDVGAGPGNSMMLTFTPANALTPQTVTVTATDDAAVEGAHTGVLTHSATSADANYNGAVIASVTANITDNDEEAPQLVFLANDCVFIDDNQESDGDVHSNDKIEFDKTWTQGNHTGNLTAVGNIKIEDKNKILGNVTAGGEVELTGSANVTGAVSEFAGVAAMSLPTLSFSAGGADVIVPYWGSRTLAPGSYDRVEVKYKGALYLSAGNYYINVLDTDESAKLSINVAGGAMHINVVYDLRFDSKVQVLVSGGSTELVTFSVLQDPKVYVDRYAVIRGNLIAPNSEVHFIRDSKFKGYAAAESIILGAKVKFQHHSSATPFPKENDFEEAETDEGQSLVTSYALEQNYPNPFNPSTAISFQLPAESEVSLVIYNSQGQVVKQVASGKFASGRHSVVWDAKDERGERVASGVYMYVIKAGEFTAQRKLVLMK